jgi:hypothetical protein
MDLIKHFWYLIHVERQNFFFNSISSDIIDDTIVNNYNVLVSIIFKQFGRCFELFDIAE